jgi:hypothetical protein
MAAPSSCNNVINNLGNMEQNKCNYNVVTHFGANSKFMIKI